MTTSRRAAAARVGAAASVNPLHYLVDAERALSAGDVLDATVLGGLVAAGQPAALGLWVGTRSMSRAD